MSNREMTEKELVDLGRVVVKSAEFESRLDWAIPLMLGVSEDIYTMLVQGKTLGPKVGLLEAVTMAKAKDDRLKAALKTFWRHVDAAVKKRNIVVHGLWSPGGQGDSLWVLLHPELSGLPIAAKSNKNANKVDADTLSVLAETFQKLDDNIRGIYWELFVPRVRKKKRLARNPKKAKRRPSAS